MDKRKRNLILLAVGWVVVAIAVLVIGFSIAGNNVWEWLTTSKWAIMLYTFLGLYALFIIIYIVLPMIRERL